MLMYNNTVYNIRDCKFYNSLIFKIQQLRYYLLVNAGQGQNLKNYFKELLVYLMLKFIKSIFLLNINAFIFSFMLLYYNL
jgi:hypothetical protein